jgi:hypothetical protein
MVHNPGMTHCARRKRIGFGIDTDKRVQTYPRHRPLSIVQLQRQCFDVSQKLLSQLGDNYQKS